MSLALKIIGRAYSKIGVKASESPLSASELSDGVDVLNDLLASWDATGTLKGVARVYDVSDELSEPRHATWALKANVALSLAGEYGIALSQGMVYDATESVNQMVTAATNLRDVEFPSTLPIGSGNRDEYGTGYDRDFIPENTKRNF